MALQNPCRIMKVKSKDAAGTLIKQASSVSTVIYYKIQKMFDLIFVSLLFKVTVC